MKLLLVKLALTLLVVIAFSLPFFYPSLGSGFLEELELLGVGGALVLFSGFLVLVYFYCKDLQKILTLIAPANRAATPRSVWLMFLIPYNFVEDFFIVYHVSQSIERESGSNPALGELKSFGLYSGVGWCVAQIVTLAPGELGRMASVVAIGLWVVHWRFVRRVIDSLSAASH